MTTIQNISPEQIHLGALVVAKRGWREGYESNDYGTVMELDDAEAVVRWECAPRAARIALTDIDLARTTRQNLTGPRVRALRDRARAESRHRLVASCNRALDPEGGLSDDEEAIAACVAAINAAEAMQEPERKPTAFDRYLEECMQRPEFRAAYESALNEMTRPTTAQRVAAVFGGDGRRMRTADDRTFEEVCEDAGGSCGGDSRVQGEIRLWTFRDGSSLEEQVGYCWDFEFEREEEESDEQ